MMAAAQADRDLLYYTFDESYCGQTLEEWIKQINMLIDQHHPTVGDIYGLLVRKGPCNMFEQLLQHYAAKGESDEPQVSVREEPITKGESDEQQVTAELSSEPPAREEPTTKGESDEQQVTADLAPAGEEHKAKGESDMQQVTSELVGTDS
jgi:hypothetical protein